MDTTIPKLPETPCPQKARKRLTDTALRAVKPRDKPYKLACGHGLYLEVQTSGSKLWRLKYRLAGKESRYAIGEYPQVLLTDARTLADDARKLVASGVHPAHQRKLLRIQASQDANNSFQSLAGEWLTTKDWTPVTKHKRLALLKRHVFPGIGKLPVKQVTPHHVLGILTKLPPSVAVEAKRTISGVFQLAVSTLRADSDPTYPVRNALKATKTRHKQALSPSDLGQLLSDIDGASFQVQAAFKLMWLTICRPSEVTGAQWREFDLDTATWCIPTERMKRRQQHTVPLPRQAVDLLRAVHQLTGRYQYVFPARGGHLRPMSPGTLRQALYMLGWAGRYSPHATRVTGSTRLNEMAYPPDWIETQLAHQDTNAVRRTYNHARYLDDRRAMMQGWADWLDAIRSGAGVLPIRKPA